jgi:parallel beta-helix repeat protein
MYSYSFILIVFLLTSVVDLKENANDPSGERAAEATEDFPCRKCDYIVKGYHNNGELLHIKPGQVICFDASMHYEKAVLSYIKGTKEKPIIIRNCGGVATISSPKSFALKIEHSEHFKLLGDGVADSTYGLRITTKSGFFVSLEQFTTDFEIARVEIAGANKNGFGEGAGFAGIGIKTSPYQDCALFTDSTRQAWVMRNVSVHHNYIHDTGGEGMYIGHGFYKGRKEKACPAKTYSHSIKGLRVYNNIVENTGFDGIQIKNADDDCEVYNNTIRNFGTRAKGAQNEGLFIGEGVTGKVYNNLIDTGTGHGISFQGMGNNQFYNNVILNAGDDGFNGSGSSMAVYIPDGYFMIFNNTIYNSREDGFVFFHNHGGKKIVMNNLVVKAGHKLTSRGGRLDSCNNIFTQDINRIRFRDRDTLHADLRLRTGSPAINRGIDVRKYNKDLTFDFLKNPRPKGSAFDIGAYENE